MSRRLDTRLKRTRAGDALVRRNPLYYGGARRMFDRFERVPLEERRRLTQDRLRVVLDAAQTHTRYGKSLAAGPSLADWPLLPKDAVRDDPGAFSNRQLLAARASTSGTTGTPLALFRSPQSVAVEQAAIDRLAAKGGVDLRRARIAVLRGDDVGEPLPGRVHWRDEGRGRRRVFQSNDLSETTLAEFHEALAAFRPDALLAYPTVLESLCLLLVAGDRRLHVPLTLTSSEVLTRATRRLAEDVLSTSLVDYYGQAERVSSAYSLDDGVYTFLPGYGCTELIPVERGRYEDTCEIVGTSLWNGAMPLIRYRTGDFVHLPAGTSAERRERICYGIESLEAIAGRADDYLVAAGGGRVVGIDHIPRDVANIVRVQVIQERRDAVRVLVRAQPGFGNDDRRRLEENIKRKLPPATAYSIEVVDVLEQRGGKTPFVIRREGV